ncbi:potassium channel protein [Sphingobium sp. AS12]|uniref:potassium channel family protein n=1 Tax=Sphingobium sp. AS12 TaxID=2849495 RepID=UPI001C315F93|nr:potassium channel family protein [Sphingobium sp. AS12]MBV2148793.1 potassium channel protein [Sphingobium sp. AS12]
MVQDRTGSDTASLFASPARLLVGTLIFVGIVFVAAVSAYVAAGWPVADAAYMVTLTIFSVGYGEVRPIATPYLRAVTIATMVLGCTGMIVLTGALVQMFAAIQLRRLLGLDRMQTLIERLSGHVVICGFGRIGVQLAKELHAAGTPFVILERDGGKIAEAQALGYLCHRGEATEESALRTVRIDRAKILATVLPDDAANVFITLSARNMNPGLEIIARGEAPTTESKLLHAGADKVVLPTHIGAERIAEMILYPSTAGFVANSAEMGQMKRGLHEFGLELEMVVVPDKGAMTGVTVGEAERRGRGAFFVVQIDHANGKSIQHPGEEVRLEAQDQVLLVVRGSRVSAGAIFTAPAQRQRTGRTFFG